MRKFIQMTLPVVIVLIMSASLSSCTKNVAVPDVSNVTMEDAKIVLSNAGLIPVIEYAYSDTCAEGNVIETAPKNGEQVEP